MKAFQTVMFVIAMVLATTQTMRHVYVKWVIPDGSVLDQFQTETESDIAAAHGVEELIPLYAAAKARVEAYEADPDNPAIEGRRRTTEPYASEITLRLEIERREGWQRKVIELWFFWVAGAISVAVGIVIFGRVNGWLGMSGILVGHAEMIYWTSPLLHSRYTGAEFETLLNIKLLLSVAVMISVTTLWLLNARGLLLSREAGG